MDKEMLITSLINNGWYHQENVFSQSFCHDLLEEAKSLSWQEAKIGKGAQRQLQHDIRKDSIHWLGDSPTALQSMYLVQMEELMAVINRELYLGLKEFECHFAHYSPSGFYKKHLDQHAGSQARVLSTITYLNEPLKGGELVIYKKDATDEVAMTVRPKPGSFVCFLSNQIYHEVLPTENARYSLAGWFRTSFS